MKLIISALLLLLLTGCTELTANTVYGTVQAIDGNKIVAFQDFDTKLDGTTDRTTFIVVRVEGDAAGGSLSTMMVDIANVLLGTNVEE